MNPNEIKNLVETITKDQILSPWLIVFISILTSVVCAFLISFLNEKGKNYATKKDIDIITRMIEQVKADIVNDQEIKKLKRELKYKTLLNSLAILDAHNSHFITVPGAEIQKQFSNINNVRECHNSLILTVENIEIVNLFMKLIYSKSGMNAVEFMQYLQDLNNYRNLVRNELGFGEASNLESEHVWIGSLDFIQNHN